MTKTKSNGKLLYTAFHVRNDNTIRYFADKELALSALREIAEAANKVIQNCLKSMDIFS